MVDEKCVPAREIRVAITMVGGIALAIYESGVAQEMFRMVHGQGLYGVLKRLTHSHAYIDVLSGTSAGGINTICLSAALTVGTDFRLLHDVWISLGGIDELLQDPKNTDAKSLLRGNTYYIKELTRVFERLCDASEHVHWITPGIPSGRPGIQPGISHYVDLDLFVTGTYFQGQPRVFFDARNQPMFNHDYAGIFHLKHRARRDESHFHPGMKDPSTPPPRPDDPGPNIPWPGDNPDTPRRRAGVANRLARVARTTSSLPAVFEPSGVERHLMNGIIELPERKVNYMGDGGYLNKQPLNLVLRQIVQRAASQEVLRKVFFVEPVPERLLDNYEEEVPEPTALEHLAFYREVPHRQNIIRYLDEVYQHNNRVRRVNGILNAAQQTVTARNAQNQNGDPYSDCCAEQHDLWIALRLQELRDGLIERWERTLGLEGFSTLVQNEEKTTKTPDGTKDRKSRADELRALRTRLLEHMEANCRD
ncbi:MAG: patatin-like phospholipase family protein [Armatimonadota bacterium]|nr:patatin-like phospholipase family protein [Armatimonadota bacterium]